ncbi:hypothetical protein [uncultured Desulfobulbus sp.]|uniref:hypothetical protein n=1 Tax=uncultured Desulfobulbus sp. TaxID=239745 RepID=UPI0029C8AF10|nr:hypothetical protein [uncultured Desulfobulbus sp.]
MKKIFCIACIVISMILLTAVYSVSFAADADTPTAGDKLDIKDLVEQVDVLQIVTDMNLKPDQLSFMAARIDFLSQKRDETQKKEKALQLEIREPLMIMRDAFIAGKDVPAEARNAAFAKLKPIKQTRQDMQTAFNDAANSCVDMLDDGQRRVLGRTADVLSRAQKMIQEIQSVSEDEWPKTMASLAAEIIKVKESDRYGDWQTQVDNVQNLPASEREQAYQNLEGSRKAELDQMQADAEQLLQSVRSANRQVLPIALNKLAGALKSQTELHNQLFGAMVRVLDSPGAPAALKARIEVMKAATDKKAGK